MEILIIMAVVSLITVCGIIADFARLLAQIAENEKTPEGRERNRRFSEFLYMNGIG